MRLPEYPLVFQMVQRAVQGFFKVLTSIAKLAWGLKDIRGIIEAIYEFVQIRVAIGLENSLKVAHTVMDPNRAEANDVESNAPALAEGTVSQESRPLTVSQGGREGAREAFLHMMDAWYTEFVQTNRNAQPPPPSPIPQPILVAPLIFEELSCTLEECMKCVVSLLRDWSYHWWKTFVSVVPREKQGRIIVTEYKHEFVRLSKYAQECVSTEAIMCNRFEDGLNEDIRMFVGMLELKEFVLLVERDCKTEELAKEKRKVNSIQVLRPRPPRLLVSLMLNEVDWNVHNVIDVTPMSVKGVTGPVLSVVSETTLLESASR
ncbi:Retrotransposon gag domain-containing 1 [Gossypium arboreum]|uniref:Retrotransposon gag domain-containing 1 n=1 Tax=Gossypium arboreum TaxID=29729 RepID=A0A0B0N3A0_GOSAR|nr:Retrotransposon gag domain-containing 1 [Gossypium arboreum]